MNVFEAVKQSVTTRQAAAPSAISDARADLSGSRFFVVVVMTVVTGGRVVVTGVFVVTVAVDRGVLFFTAVVLSLLLL